MFLNIYAPMNHSCDPELDVCHLDVVETLPSNPIQGIFSLSRYENCLLANELKEGDVVRVITVWPADGESTIRYYHILEVVEGGYVARQVADEIEALSCMTFKQVQHYKAENAKLEHFLSTIPDFPEIIRRNQ